MFTEYLHCIVNCLSWYLYSTVVLHITIVSFCQNAFKAYAEIPLSMANGDKNIKPMHTEWAFFKDLMEHFFKMHEVIKLH